MTLSYDANNGRWKQMYVKGSTTETTWYLGGLLQKMTSGSTTDWRHNIYANGKLVSVYSRKSTGTNTFYYTLEDHQGSLAKITSSAGATTVSENFSAFGNRRNPSTWSGSPTSTDLTTINGISRIGYTEQEVLGSMGLNHMNGRVQDAITGRFLSADPYISEPGNTQNYNRYSYVYNNPMTFTDPSGFYRSNGYQQDGKTCYDEIGWFDDLVHSTMCVKDDDVSIVQYKYENQCPWWSLACNLITDTPEEVKSDSGGGGGSLAPQTQNTYKPGTCSSNGSVAGKVADVAGNVSNVASGVAIVSGGAALATSETIVGGLTFGAIAGTAEIISLGATGVQAGAQYLDKNYDGLKQTLAGVAYSLGMNVGFGRVLQGATAVTAAAKAEYKYGMGVANEAGSQIIQNVCP